MAQPRDLEVEGRRAAIRDREIGAAPPRPIGLEGQLDARIRQEHLRHAQLGPHVTQGIRVGRRAQLLADLVAVRLGEGTEPGRGRQPFAQLLGQRIAGSTVEQVARQPLDDGPGSRLQVSCRDASDGRRSDAWTSRQTLSSGR